MRSFYIFILIAIQTLGIAQGFKVRHYLPGTQNNTAKSIFEISPGNYITGGVIIDNVNGMYSNRLCLTGLDSLGQIQWVKKYGNYKFEYLDNNYISRSYYKKGNHIYYTGCVRDSNNKQIGILIKFDSSGDTLWQKVYRDTVEDVIPQMVTASVDGGFLLTGFFQNWTANTRSCLLVKTDINGNELWRKKISKVLPNVNDGKSIVQDSTSKKIIVVGYQYSGNPNSVNITDNVLILDSLGVKIVQLSYMSLNGNILFDLIQTKDKKFVAVGQKRQPEMIGAIETYKSVVLKFDINNPTPPIWVKFYDIYSQDNQFTCINEYPNGDLLISGNLDTLLRYNIQQKMRIKFIRLDEDGNNIWTRYYDYANSQPYNASINHTSIGTDNCILASIGLSNIGTNPFFFVKYDSLGCDTAAAYCQMIAAGIGKNYTTDQGINLYPNPGNDLYYLTIPTTAETCELKLVISDLLGKTIKEMPIGAQQEKQEICLRELNKGMYMINLLKDKKTIYNTKLIKQN